jgi:hypothetical protein
VHQSLCLLLNVGQTITGQKSHEKKATRTKIFTMTFWFGDDGKLDIRHLRWHVRNYARNVSHRDSWYNAIQTMHKHLNLSHVLPW